MERFQLCLKKSRHNMFSLKSLKLIFPRGINEDYIDALNLMGSDDITQAIFDYIYKLSRNYSRFALKKNKSHSILPTTKTYTSFSRWS